MSLVNSKSEQIFIAVKDLLNKLTEFSSALQEHARLSLACSNCAFIEKRCLFFQTLSAKRQSSLRKLRAKYNTVLKDQQQRTLIKSAQKQIGDNKSKQCKKKEGQFVIKNQKAICKETSSNHVTTSSSANISLCKQNKQNGVNDNTFIQNQECKIASLSISQKGKLDKHENEIGCKEKHKREINTERLTENNSIDDYIGSLRSSCWQSESHLYRKIDINDKIIQKEDDASAVEDNFFKQTPSKVTRSTHTHLTDFGTSELHSDNILSINKNDSVPNFLHKHSYAFSPNVLPSFQVNHLSKTLHSNIEQNLKDNNMAAVISENDAIEVSESPFDVIVINDEEEEEESNASPCPSPKLLNTSSSSADMMFLESLCDLDDLQKLEVDSSSNYDLGTSKSCIRELDINDEIINVDELEVISSQTETTHSWLKKSHSSIDFKQFDSSDNFSNSKEYILSQPITVPPGVKVSRQFSSQGLKLKDIWHLNCLDSEDSGKNLLIRNSQINGEAEKQLSSTRAPTPEGYWNIGFPDSPQNGTSHDTIEIQHQPRRKKSFMKTFKSDEHLLK